MTLEKIIKQVAKQNRTSPDQVYKEMKFAFEQAKNNTDPLIQARWDTIPHEGEDVSLEDLILHIASLIKLPS